ncbi:UNVERIFIED_CONTAM: hypothetical protein GTU68_065825 [Idotea baltica]|nr:hypothetical protein [Idotea baltica]
MGRKRRNQIHESISFEGIAAKGKALSRIDGKVIFTDNALPGDIATVRVYKNKKDYAFAKIQTLHTPSEDRIEPFCEHFTDCGGCNWQYLGYEKQLEYKQNIVEDNFKFIGKFDYPLILPILGCDETRYYRNKLEFTYTSKRWIPQSEVDSGKEIENRNGCGFHVPGMFSKVVDLDHCYLQGQDSNKIRNKISKIALDNDWTFYNLENHEGWLRNLILRSNIAGEYMLTLSVAYDAKDQIEQIYTILQKEFPFIISYHYVVNSKLNDSLGDQDILHYSGAAFLTETIGELKFKISPKSFFQTNSKQTQKLYDVVKEFAAIQKKEVVYDLYCGTGSITLYLAKEAKQILGIETVAEAIIDAKENATLNRIHNATFIVGDVKDILTEKFRSENDAPDVIILDPPRAGLHPEMIATLFALLPERIVYVSCNPATQARDLSLLLNKYVITKTQPVDMFPHTYHIENVVLLEKQ